jgi:hypothetical protein
MGRAERANRDNGGNGVEHAADPSADAARDIIKIMLATEGAVAQAKKAASMAIRPIDMTPMILDIMAAQSRTLGLLLAEVLKARGVDPRVRFLSGPPPEEARKPALIVCKD